MSPKVALLAAILAASALAMPAVVNLPQDDNYVHKRTPPRIADGFSSRQLEQLDDALPNAIQLASYMTRLPRSSVDLILAKYFYAADFDKVINVFQNIVGPDAGKPGGNEMLQNILISPDFPDKNGELACARKKVAASLRDYREEQPTLILCDSAFTHGGIGEGYGSIPGLSVPAVDCDNFDEHVSWKMDTLGATLLHEYTHYVNLQSPPLDDGTKDFGLKGYGALNTRTLDKALASINADSYAWAATENLWTTICGHDFVDPREADSLDPGCNMLACWR